MTGDQLSFLVCTAFLVFLLWVVLVPYAFRLRKRDAPRREQTSAILPITIDRTRQTVVITITLRTVADPPRAG